LGRSSRYKRGPLAQSVEQKTFNLLVEGSNPSRPTTLLKDQSAGDSTSPAAALFSMSLASVAGGLTRPRPSRATLGRSSSREAVLRERDASPFTAHHDPHPSKQGRFNIVGRRRGIVLVVA
jgi:hypothetical protein